MPLGENTSQFKLGDITSYILFILHLRILYNFIHTLSEYFSIATSFNAKN